MKKTLLLCFIHGFKGGDDTFGPHSDFTQHLAAIVSAALPRLHVRVLVYPKYETRGDLHECVARFRDWLLEKVIDIEVAAGTPSPTVDPSVRTVLIGHSMGGIVAAETAIGLASEKPITPEGEGEVEGEGQGEEDGKGWQISGLMFPYIQGVLAFDTPYLGISPGVVAHGAEGHYNSAAAAWTEFSVLTTSLWGSSKVAESAVNREGRPAAALPAPPAHEHKKETEKASSSSWGWGKIAMVAGAGVAVAAGGVAAYLNRDHITEGWGWVSSHLEFVGCLARGEELRDRVKRMVRLNKELDVGFANLYTRLGAAASSKQVSSVGLVLGHQRTFCNLPSRQAAGDWKAAINDKAEDETTAHMTMFYAEDNPGYEKLSEDAKDLIVSWAKNDWYETSAEELE